MTVSFQFSKMKKNSTKGFQNPWYVSVHVGICYDNNVKILSGEDFQILQGGWT